jgi:hypothetical protein
VQRAAPLQQASASAGVFNPKEANMITIIEALKTRRDRAEKALRAVGVEGHALDALLNESAHLRHAHRVKLARAAAEDYYLEQAKLTRDDLTPESLAVHVAVICYLDILGIGGYYGGVTGHATDRHPAFARCGKGRKRAVDGDAWSAAIDQLTFKHIRTIHGFVANENGLVSFQAVNDDVSVEPAHGPAEWRLTLAREGLRRAAGLEPMFCDVPMKAGSETIVCWSRAVNQIMDELKQESEAPEVSVLDQAGYSY